MMASRDRIGAIPPIHTRTARHCSVLAGGFLRVEVETGLVCLPSSPAAGPVPTGTSQIGELAAVMGTTPIFAALPRDASHTSRSSS